MILYKFSAKKFPSLWDFWRCSWVP